MIGLASRTGDALFFVERMAFNPRIAIPTSTPNDQGLAVMALMAAENPRSLRLNSLFVPILATVY